jgi:3-deoxy-manno-octulosonate cytidylyltransferase (CMP-KDO synthetase)
LERAAEAGCFAEILCFTDSPEIGEAVAGRGFRFVLTGEAANGTERIARNLGALSSELVVNLQGDEPAFSSEGLHVLCEALRRNPEWVHTLVDEEPPSLEDLENPHRVKAVLDAEGFVRDFLRQAGPSVGRLHLGAYGYSADFLRRYAALPPSERERALSHELLRDPGLAPIRAHTCASGVSVDVPEDVPAALARLKARASQGVPT